MKNICFRRKDPVSSRGRLASRQGDKVSRMSLEDEAQEGNPDREALMESDLKCQPHQKRVREICLRNFCLVEGRQVSSPLR